MGYMACALAGSLWGTGFFFGKIAMREMSSAHMVFYRFLFACVGMAPILVMRRPGLNLREWRILLMASFLGIPLQFLLQFAGLSHTTVSHASLMVGTLPVVLAMGAWIFAHERLDRVGWAALLASSIGAALIALGGGSHHGAGDVPTLAGDLLVVVSMFIAMGWILLNQPAARPFAGGNQLVWNRCGNGNAVDMGADYRRTAPRPRLDNRMAGACGEWLAMHGEHNASVELGIDACSSITCGSVFEPRADYRFRARYRFSGRKPGRYRVVWRSDDSRGSVYGNFACR